MILDTNDSPNIVLPIQNLKNVKAVAFDPVDKHVYWIDGRTKTIKRAKESGKEVKGDYIHLT